MSDTESFESAVKAAMPLLLGECLTGECPKHCDCNQCGTNIADRLRRAHIREIRDTAQREYHRGYEDGQHSMDAEHRAVVMRLRHLPLDGGSHENLSQIARAIWHNDFGWTQDACMGLRDELVRLMGGVSDDACDSQCRGACTTGGCGCAGKQEEVGHGGTAHDSAADSRGRSCGDVVHMDGLVTYDVLDNERRKAVRALRRWKPEESIDNDHCGEIQIRLLYQFLGLGGAMMMDGADAAKKVRDRLVHLLGGDQPSGIDVLRAMDDGHSRTCPKSDEEMSKNAPSVSITDELREFVGTFSKRLSISVAEVNAIADRIDEQFDRICHQQEAVLQSTIDEMVDECNQLRDEDFKIKRQYAKLCVERADLQAKVDELESFDHEASIAAFGDDNGKLRRLLSRAAKLLEIAEHDRDTNYAYWMDCKEKVVHANVTIEELQAKLDAIRDALDG